MKTTKQLTILLIAFCFIKCNEGGNNIPFCKISGVNNNQLVSQSEMLKINIEFGDREGTLIDLELYIDSLRILSFLKPYIYWNIDTLEPGNFTCQYCWDTRNLKTGEHVLMVSATNIEGEMNYDLLKIKVVKTNPEVESTNALVVSPFISILRGMITKKGSANLKQAGFYWSKLNQEPNSTDNKALVKLPYPIFDTIFLNFELSKLEANTTYYYRSFAENDIALTLGGVQRLTTKAQAEVSITNNQYIDERDGVVYKVTTIGRQTWMAQNLAYLPQVDPPSTSSVTVPAYYVYDYNGANIDEAKATDNYKKYGVLYNWPAALNACPAGWHLPTYNEWYELGRYISYQHIDDPEHSRYEFYISKYLKATSGWGEGANGNDMYNFSALPGGAKDNIGFHEMGEYAIWLSSSEFDEQQVRTSQLYISSNSFQQNTYSKATGYSIRCIKD